MNNYNSNVVESDSCPNMRLDLLYKSNINFISCKFYKYSNFSR